MKRFLSLFVLLFVCALIAYPQQYALKSVEGKRIEVTCDYDAKVDYGLIADYKPVVDSMMCPVLGESAVFMDASRPESLLSNWVADVLVSEADRREWDVDLGLCNIGGLRSAMPKGPVTIGDVMAISPFENRLCLLSLKGDVFFELMQQIAMVGGEGVSSSLKMEISADGKLINVSVKGMPIDKSKTYNIVTIDYLAEGNDGMVALKKASKRLDTDSLLREVLMGFIRKEASNGVLLNSAINGRIVKLAN